MRIPGRFFRFAAHRLRIAGRANPGGFPDYEKITKSRLTELRIGAYFRASRHDIGGPIEFP
jgi:hypothetical protein